VSETPALSIANLSKRFGGALALDRVGLTVRRGEVHGLLGSNGSGKSTLIKVLAGFHWPEPGAEVRLYGRLLPLPIPGPKVRGYGLAFVHQHLGLIPSLTVTENLRLGDLAARDRWHIDWRQEQAAAAQVFAAYGLAIDPRAEVARLSPVEQALFAIVRAVEDLRTGGAKDPGVLVLDEPTPFLPRAGVEQLFALVRKATATGASVIFVSHDVDEVKEITDRATILRDGQFIDTVVTRDTSHDGFVSRIVGRSVAGGQGGRARPNGPVRAEVTGLTAPALGPLDLSLVQGEILGLTGLIGAGYDAVPALIYGARKAAAGRLRLNGRSLPLRSADPAVMLRRGVVYLPADRLGAAGVGSLAVADNVGLPVLPRLRRAFGLFARDVEAHAGRLGAEAGVKPNAPALPLSALSGGNAQKALLAKWLQIEPDLLLLDEPTQGVDIGAREDIFAALTRAAQGGAAILIGSTDAEQLARLCHRVLVMARGRIVAELTGAQLTKDSITETTFRSTTLAA
jgi:ribose transport system ATP-binding protein